MTYNSSDNNPTKDIILAIETSTTVCSVALHKGEELISECNLHKKNTHAEVITKSIQHLLTSTSMSFKDLAAVAIAKGPGSYTGLRIGASIAKGLCFALKIPLLSVNTLEAMAFGMHKYNSITNSKVLLCPMLDARRMEVYTLLTNSNSEILLPTCAMIINNQSFEDWLINYDIVFFGDGTQKCIPYLWQNKTAKFVNNIYPRATHIAELAYVKLKQKAVEDLSSYTPMYLKEFNDK